MGYAILRTQKLKHRASIRRSAKHSFREQETPNADKSRADDNIHLGAHSSAEVMQKVESRLPDKVRKNAVLAIEYLVTGSPETINQMSRAEQDRYFKKSLDWLHKKHGAANVVYAGIHRDEKTPHLYAYVVPLDPDTGKLNCRRFLGGSKALSDMQTDFAKSVGAEFGLERGREGSKATHQRVQQWYQAVNEAAEVKPVQFSREEVKPDKGKWYSLTAETHDGVAHRLTQKVEEAYAPIRMQAVNAKLAQERTKKAEEALKRERDEVQREKMVMRSEYGDLEYLTGHRLDMAKQFIKEQAKKEKDHEKRVYETVLERYRDIVKHAKEGMGIVKDFAVKMLDHFKSQDDARIEKAHRAFIQSSQEKGYERHEVTQTIKNYSTHSEIVLNMAENKTVDAMKVAAKHFDTHKLSESRVKLARERNSRSDRDYEPG